MERLKKRADFLRTARGRKWAMPGLVLQARRQDFKSGEARVGFTASRKVGNAVERNRTKRRLRSAADEILGVHGQAGHDYVLIARKGTLLRPYGDLLNDLKTALRRVEEKLGARKNG